MATTLNPQIGDDERYVLHNVTWQTYLQLLKDYESRSLPRFSYDRGELEIMSPSLPHEAASDILRLLVNIICEERELDVLAFQDELYHIVPESVALPRISSAAVTRFVNDSFMMQRPEWLRAVRDWIRSIERETSI